MMHTRIPSLTWVTKTSTHPDGQVSHDGDYTVSSNDDEVDDEYADIGNLRE